MTQQKQTSDIPLTAQLFMPTTDIDAQPMLSMRPIKSCLQALLHVVIDWQLTRSRRSTSNRRRDEGKEAEDGGVAAIS